VFYGTHEIVTCIEGMFSAFYRYSKSLYAIAWSIVSVAFYYFHSYSSMVIWSGKRHYCSG